MNIRNNQKEYIKKQVLNSLVKNGVEPTIYEVNHLINDYFLNYDIGKCRFSYLNIKEHTLSNKEEYNKVFKDLDIDLDILSKAMQEIEKEIILKEDLITTKKKNIIDGLKGLQYKTSILEKILSTNDNYEARKFTFDDFNEVDEKYTTAFVDLKHKNVQSPMRNCNKVNYNSNLININYTGELIESNNDISSLDNFKKNSYYSLKVSSSSNTNTLDISLVFNEPVTVSLLKISLNSIQDILGSVTIYTSDNYTYNLYSQSFSEEGEWNFNYENITNITIHLTKNTPDGFNDKKYTYEYYINNISLYDVKYEDNTRYTAKPITINKIVDKVYLDKNNTIIQNSFIGCLLGVNHLDPKKLTEWFVLTDNYFDLSKFLEVKENIFNLKTLDYGKKTDDNFCYKVGKIDNYINKNSLKMLSGYQQWNVKVISKPDFNENYEININDYDTEYMLEEINLDCESYKIKFDTNKLVVFTTNVYCKNMASSKGHYMKLINDDNSELQYKVILNNNTVMPINNTYTLGFNKGKNRVIILAYIPQKINEEGNDTINLKDILFNFNFKETTLNIASGNEMKKVSYDELKYNVGSDRTDYYSIDDNNNIIIKYDPLTTPKTYIKGNIYITDYNYQDYLRFYVTYKKLRKEYEPSFIKNGEIEYTLVPTFLFRNYDEKVSSRLNSYTLLIK